MPRSDFLKIEVYGFLDREARLMSDAEFRFYICGPWRSAWEKGESRLSLAEVLPEFESNSRKSKNKITRLIKSIVSKFPSEKYPTARRLLSLSEDGNYLIVHGVTRVHRSLKRFDENQKTLPKPDPKTGTQTGTKTGTKTGTSSRPTQHRGEERRETPQPPLPPDGAGSGLPPGPPARPSRGAENRTNRNRPKPPTGPAHEPTPNASAYSQAPKPALDYPQRPPTLPPEEFELKRLEIRRRLRENAKRLKSADNGDNGSDHAPDSPSDGQNTAGD